MNAEKLHKLQAQVRIGGKGSARRKKKVVHRTATADDKKLQSSLKKLAVNNIPGIEEGVHRSHDLGGTFQLALSDADLNSSIGSIDDVVLRCQKTYDPQISISGWLSHAKVNMIKDDGSVIHFNNPKVQASLAANTFAITGHAEQKQITEMLPGILNQLGAESLTHLKRIANVQNTMGTATEQATTGAEEDDEDEDVPDLVENFDEPSKAEGV